jgi:MOSC domain-containing protein YiiM
MSQPILVQINISPGGVPKLPIEEGFVTKLGIEGDDHHHPKYHGGPNQAILLITTGAIEEMVAMGHPVFPGALGENFTVAGLDRRALRLGDRIRVGGCVIELSKMREPCRALDPYNLPSVQGMLQKKIFNKKVKAGDHSQPEWGLAGFYARVLVEGTVRRGDEVELLALETTLHAKIS